MNFQLVNVSSPNSPENTCLFSIFEAPDSISNLEIALERFSIQVDDLQLSTWR